jgi:hypothetical protein
MISVSGLPTRNWNSLTVHVVENSCTKRLDPAANREMRRLQQRVAYSKIFFSGALKLVHDLYLQELNEWVRRRQRDQGYERRKLPGDISQLLQQFDKGILTSLGSSMQSLRMSHVDQFQGYAATESNAASMASSRRDKRYKKRARLHHPVPRDAFLSFYDDSQE